jgi:2-oxoglutarate ferredoxin oxidoreductase subunit beta
MDYPEYPVPVGVIRAVRRPTYDELMTQQIDLAVATEGEGDLRAILIEGDTWTVE